MPRRQTNYYKKCSINQFRTKQNKVQALFKMLVVSSLLLFSLGEMDETVELLQDMVTDWAVGDVEDLEDELIQEMKAEMPEAYDIVFTKRNANWADQIELEMKGSGTDFIAVGAGHLVGDESVPAMLKARGYTVKRL